MCPDLSEREAELYRRCDEALYFLWDPLGVAGEAGARDEYRADLPKVFAWARSQDWTSLTEYLTRLLRTAPGDANPENVWRTVRYIRGSAASLGFKSAPS